MVEKKEIEKLIIQNKKSNLNNHWNDALSYNTTKYSGEIRSNEILIWRSSYFLRAAYPIFHLSFDQNNELSGIKKEINPFHKLINQAFIGLLSILVLTLLFTIGFRASIFGLIGLFTIVLLLYLVMSKAKRFETKILTDELKEAIENIERLNNPELLDLPKQNLKKENIKEWTFTKVFTRLLLYPFCFGMIYISSTDFLPNGKIILGMFLIIAAMVYPIADIVLIFGKNKKH